MKLKEFGETGMRVSELGFGCARVGGIFKSQPRQFVELLAAAHDHGITFFDTADMYSQGESETLLGKAFRKRRDRVIIASKVGYCLPSRRRWIARVKPLVRPMIRMLRIRRERLAARITGQISQNFSPSYIVGATEASLRRLKTDYLDVLQLHSPPAEVVVRGEWLDALERLKRSGKVRAFGVACDTVDAAHAALRFETVAALQVPVSLLTPTFVEAVLPNALEQGVAVIARECLANGWLAKTGDELESKLSAIPSTEAATLRQQLSGLRDSAARRNMSLMQLALDYATSQPGVSVALIGASRLDHLLLTLRAFGA